MISVIGKPHLNPLARKFQGETDGARQPARARSSLIDDLPPKLSQNDAATARAIMGESKPERVPVVCEECRFYVGSLAPNARGRLMEFVRANAQTASILLL